MDLINQLNEYFLQLDCNKNCKKCSWGVIPPWKSYYTCPINVTMDLIFTNKHNKES